MNRLRLYAFCALSLAFFSGCAGERLYRSRQTIAGIAVEVTSPDSRAGKIVFSEIRRIEKLLSLSDPASEVSRLNKSGQLKVSPETLFVIRKAGEIWRESGGSFDITAAPLSAVWGFNDGRCRIPSEPELKAVLGKIGFDKLRINDNIIKFTVDGMSLDLGGIGEAYAVDCAVRRLIQAGIKNALVSAGGDIYCLGDKWGKPWKVSILDSRKKAEIGCLFLRGRAVATCGNSGPYFVYKGARYYKIFDARSGRPAYSGVNSVTVIASDNIVADALAQSAYILGKEKGRKLARKFNAQMIVD
jgi:thiamine biosynthesis lipoprotein